MPLIPIDDPADPRLDDYRDLRDRVMRNRGERFMAEGHALVERVLASDYHVESAMISSKRLPKITHVLPDDLPVYVVPEEKVPQVAGYRLHTGVLAVAVRKPWPTIDQVMADATEPVTLVACPCLKESENLGSIIRTCAAFDVKALVLGTECCDPFYRRCLRVAMGAAFTLPIVRSGDFHADLDRLAAEFGFTRYATVLADDAAPLHEAARPRVGKPDRAVLVLGHEVTGLDDKTIAHCDQRITIGMRKDVDSLNVGVAAGVFLHQLMRVARRSATTWQ